LGFQKRNFSATKLTADLRLQQTNLTKTTNKGMTMNKQNNKNNKVKKINQSPKPKLNLT